MIDFANLSRANFNSQTPWKQPDFVLPGVRRGELAILAAAGASGKSYLSQMWAMSLSAGVQIFSFLPAEKPLKVLLLQFEDLTEDLTNRGNAVLRAYPELENRDLNDNFFAAALPGQCMDLVGVVDGAETVNERAEAELKDFLQGYDLAILDPLTNIWSGCDENNQGVAMQLMMTLRRVAVHSNSAILVCHHINKASMFLGKSNEAGAVRGSGAIVNSPRCVLTMSPVKNDFGNINSRETSLNWVKLNNHSPIDPRVLYRGYRGVLYEDHMAAALSVSLGDGTSVSENPFAGGMSDDNLY